MRKYRVGLGFSKEAEESLKELKEFMENHSPFEKVELEKCPLSIVVSTDKYSYLSTSDMESNINSLTKAFKFSVSEVLVFDYN